MRWLVFTLLLVTFSAHAGWRDQPLFNYDPNFRPENLNNQVLQRTTYLSSQQLNTLLSQHGEDPQRPDRIYVPLDAANVNFVSLAAATSLGLVIFKNDQELMDNVQLHKDLVPSPIVDFGNMMGTITGIGPVAVGSYFLGVVMENDKLKSLGLIIVAAEAATGIVTESFKVAFSRVRPNAATSAYDFFVPGNKSFFSGHTSGAFSLATVIAEMYGKEHPWVPYLAYGAAALTAYARMHDKKHWGSDVLVGAIAGHLITKIVYRMMTDRDVPEDEQWLSIMPMYNPGTGMIGFQVDYVPKAWRPR